MMRCMSPFQAYSWEIDPFIIGKAILLTTSAAYLTQAFFMKLTHM